MAGSTRYIEVLRSEGVVVSVGHTAATPGQIRDAVEAGATLSTHSATAVTDASQISELSVDQLAEDRLAASFIADGIHLDPDFFRVALRSKGTERSILVTMQSCLRYPRLGFTIWAKLRSSCTKMAESFCAEECV